MKSGARRLRRLEQAALVNATKKNSSSVLCAVENACRDGRISEGAVIVSNYLKDQIARYKDDQDALVQFYFQDPVLTQLSFSAVARLLEYYLAEEEQGAGTQEFEEVTMRKLIPRTPSEKTEVTIRVPRRLIQDPRYSDLFEPKGGRGDIGGGKRRANSEV